MKRRITPSASVVGGTLQGVRLQRRRIPTTVTPQAFGSATGTTSGKAGKRKSFTAANSPCSKLHGEALRFLRCSQVKQSVDFEEARTFVSAIF